MYFVAKYHTERSTDPLVIHSFFPKPSTDDSVKNILYFWLAKNVNVSSFVSFVNGDKITNVIVPIEGATVLCKCVAVIQTDDGKDIPAEYFLCSTEKI